ncbi:MAG: hypothetical protein ACKVWR_07105 [Acidimicrobiales bacterium]
MDGGEIGADLQRRRCSGGRRCGRLGVVWFVHLELSKRLEDVVTGAMDVWSLKFPILHRC